MSQIKLHGVRPQAAHWPGRSEHLLLLSLLNPDDPDVAAIGPRHRGKYPNGSLEEGSVSLDAMVDMGFASTTTVRAQGNAKARYFVQDLCRYTPLLPNPLYETTHTCVKSVSWGVGARMCVAAWSLQGELDITDIRQIAAHTDSKLAGSYFEIQVFGANVEVMKLLKPLLAKQASGFDVEAYSALSKVRGDLVGFFNDSANHDSLLPEPVAAEVDFHRIGHRPGDEPVKHLLASEVYALEMVQQWGHGPDRAISDGAFTPSHYPRAVVDERIVRRTYRDLFGLEGTGSPSGDDRRLAQTINAAGR